MKSIGKADTEKLFQALLAIALFVPTILAALGGNAEEHNPTILNWGIVIAILIPSYLLWEFFRETFSARTPLYMNILIVVNLLSFSLLLGLTATYQETIAGVLLVGLAASIAITMFVPLIIFILLTFQILWYFLKKTA